MPQLKLWYGFHDQETHAPVAGCDWPLATDIRNQIDSFDPNTDTATLPIPFELVNSKSPKDITNTLILRTYEAKRQNLQMEIDESRQILSGYEKGTPTGPRANGDRIVKDPVLGPMTVTGAEAEIERKKLDQCWGLVDEEKSGLIALLVKRCCEQIGPMKAVDRWRFHMRQRIFAGLIKNT